MRDEYVAGDDVADLISLLELCCCCCCCVEFKCTGETSVAAGVARLVFVFMCGFAEVADAIFSDELEDADVSGGGGGVAEFECLELMDDDLFKAISVLFPLKFDCSFAGIGLLFESTFEDGCLMVGLNCWWRGEASAVIFVAELGLAYGFTFIGDIGSISFVPVLLLLLMLDCGTLF